MEFYPAELTSPPVPLVALVGKPELHLSIGDFLRTQNVPRVHSIGIQDAHSAAGTFGEGRRLPLPPPAAAAAARCCHQWLPPTQPWASCPPLWHDACRLQEGCKQQQPPGGHPEGRLVAETPHCSPRSGGSVGGS